METAVEEKQKQTVELEDPTKFCGNEYGYLSLHMELQSLTDKEIVSNVKRMKKLKQQETVPYMYLHQEYKKRNLGTL